MLKSFIILDSTKILNKKNLIAVIITVFVLIFFLQFGIIDYKFSLDSIKDFQKFEQEKIKEFLYPSNYGNYGLRLIFCQSPYMAFYDAGPVPGEMTSHIDGSERTRVYNPLEGRNAFSGSSIGFLNYSGIILIFVTLLVLIYGYWNYNYNPEWLIFLEGVEGSRIKVFFFLMLSNALFLLIFSLCLLLLSSLLFLINGISFQLSPLAILHFYVYLMLFIFFLIGFLCGSLKNKIAGLISMISIWFLLVLLIPGILLQATIRLSRNIKSSYLVEIDKQKTYWAYEKKGKELRGRFSDNRRDTDDEKRMFLEFWGGNFQEYLKYEESLIKSIKDNVETYQLMSGFFPSTFFISLNNEISSRGYNNLILFQEYTQKMKKDFIWYIAENHIFSKKKEFPPFISGNENIFYGKATLPGNTSFGLTMSVLWIVLLLVGAWIIFFYRDTENKKLEFNLEDIKENKTTVIVKGKEKLIPALISILNGRKMEYLIIPKLGSLPENIKVKNLFRFCGIIVPEKIKHLSNTYIGNLSTDSKGMVILEIARNKTAQLIIFNEFVTGGDISDSFLDYFAESLNEIKSRSECRILYLSSSLSLLLNQKICDEIITIKEKPVSLTW